MDFSSTGNSDVLVDTQEYILKGKAQRQEGTFYPRRKMKMYECEYCNQVCTMQITASTTKENERGRKQIF